MDVLSLIILRSHFENNYKWKEIYSYADRRWSQGKLYEAIGFKLDGVTPPNYWYIVDKGRKHRFSYRKSVLKNKLKKFDENLSERENMKMNGYNRIWDCGNNVFIRNN